MKKYIILSLLMLVFILSHAQNQTGFYYKKKGRNTFTTYTPDGKYLAVSKKKRLSFYRCNTLYVDRSLKNKGKIKRFAITSENTLAATYSQGIFKSYISLWNYESLTRVKRIKLAKGKLIEFDFVNDSSIAYIDNKSYLRILNLTTGTYSYDTLLSNKPLRALAVQGDEGILATGGADRKLYIMNIYNKSIQTLPCSENWIRTIDIFSDGTKIVCGSDDKKCYYYDLADPSKNFNFMVHKNWIRDVTFTQDANYVASVSDDKSCVFYDLKNRRINFRIKERTFDPDICIHPFGKEFVLNSAYQKTVYPRDISALNIIPYKKLKDKSDKLAPQIYISQPARIEEGRVVVFNHLYPITGTAIDESGLRDIKINGRPIKVKENGSFIIYVPLTIGDNPICIEAIDINDNVSIKKFVLVRKSELGEDVDTTQTRNYLVVIGINTYTSWPTLGNAVRDAKSVYSVLEEKYGFDSSYATILLDTAATKENIDKTIRGLISKVSSSDNLIIYYAGHGYFDPILNEGYWVPVNAQNQSDYLSNTTLLKYLSNINSKHTFLVVDACFSGSLFATRSRGYVENVEKYRSRWCLTSGRLETVADGAYGENSPFASSFIDFLNNNSKEEFPVSEVVQYVKLQVANNSNQTPIGSALRDVGDEGGEFVFKRKK